MFLTFSILFISKKNNSTEKKLYGGIENYTPFDIIDEKKWKFRKSQEKLNRKTTQSPLDMPA